MFSVFSSFGVAVRNLPKTLWNRTIRQNMTKHHVDQGISFFHGLHSLELTWKWRMAPWKTIFHYKQVVFHFHVSFRECRVHPEMDRNKRQLRLFTRNPLTMSLSSTLCLLHFIAAFLALWGAPYLAESAWGAPSPAVAVATGHEAQTM